MRCVVGFGLRGLGLALFCVVAGCESKAKGCEAGSLPALFAPIKDELPPDLVICGDRPRKGWEATDAPSGWGALFPNSIAIEAKTGSANEVYLKVVKHFEDRGWARIKNDVTGDAWFGAVFEKRNLQLQVNVNALREGRVGGGITLMDSPCSVYGSGAGKYQRCEGDSLVSCRNGYPYAVEDCAATGKSCTLQGEAACR